MVNGLKKLSTLFILGVAITALPAQAQLDEIQNFLNSGSTNATALTEAYLSPLPTGLSTSLNSGWTSKAAPTKKLGFSLQFRTALTAVPTSAQTFDANDLSLSGITVTGTESNTISGDNSTGQSLRLPDNSTLSLPGGTGFSYVPTVMLQGNVGLIKGTDLTLRYIPETALGDFGDIAVVGAGVKHGLNQWLPGGKLLPVDLSVMAAFTQITLNANLDFNNGTDQKVETTTDAFVLNALVGKTLPFLSAYAGVGFQTGSFELNMLGDYDLGGGVVLSDPVSYTADSDAAIHALAGAQFKLAIFRIYAEATIAEYATYNIGIGIGLR